MTRWMTVAALAATLGACGHESALLGKDAFVQAARDCHATGYSYRASAVKDGAPEVSVVDTTVEIDGRPVGVGRCVADRIAGTRYGHLQLQAPPNVLKG